MKRIRAIGSMGTVKLNEIVKRTKSHTLDPCGLRGCRTVLQVSVELFGMKFVDSTDDDSGNKQ